MRKILIVRRVALLGLVLWGLAMLISQDHAQARPQYFKAFPKKYENLAEKVKTTKCNVCHINKKKKKNRNDYGKALAKHMKKKTKSVEAINAAFAKAEKEKNKKGVTFGSLIKDGKLPATKK